MVARPRLHDENLRTRLLDEAGRVVTERGVAGLSLRILAAEADTSTSAVYSLFGGKSGLLTALFAEAFASFGAAQRAVPRTGDLVADLAGLAAAYWEWAREHPHLYAVMFGPALAGVERSPDEEAAAWSTIEPLAGVVRTAVDSGLLAGDPATITFSIWAATHGVVSLAMAGCVPPEETAKDHLFQAAAAAMVRGWFAPAGAGY